MIAPVSVITKINESCKVFFTESDFFLQPKRVNKFRITGRPMSYALNNYKNDSEKVNVLKWFDDFWIFVQLRFEKQNTFISLSIFQGTERDEKKHQLFRAEWDDYNNPKEYHPQPHWHITSNQAMESTFIEYSESFDDGDFISLLKEEQTKVININKIHFAMNGNWLDGDSHIYSINDEEKIVKWFQGILSHIKEQLVYVK